MAETIGLPMMSAKSSSSLSSPVLRWLFTADRRFEMNSCVSSIVSSFTIIRFIDSEISLHDIPMLIAVSCLSPVRTHT